MREVPQEWHTKHAVWWGTPASTAQAQPGSSQHADLTIRYTCRLTFGVHRPSGFVDGFTASPAESELPRHRVVRSGVLQVQGWIWGARRRRRRELCGGSVWPCFPGCSAFSLCADTRGGWHWFQGLPGGCCRPSLKLRGGLKGGREGGTATGTEGSRGGGWTRALWRCLGAKTKLVQICYWYGDEDLARGSTALLLVN